MKRTRRYKKKTHTHKKSVVRRKERKKKEVTVASIYRERRASFYQSYKTLNIRSAAKMPDMTLLCEKRKRGFYIYIFFRALHHPILSCPYFCDDIIYTHKGKSPPCFQHQQQKPRRSSFPLNAQLRVLPPPKKKTRLPLPIKEEGEKKKQKGREPLPTRLLCTEAA